MWGEGGAHTHALWITKVAVHLTQHAFPSQRSHRELRPTMQQRSSIQGVRTTAGQRLHSRALHSGLGAGVDGKTVFCPPKPPVSVALHHLGDKYCDGISIEFSFRYFK